MKHKSVSSFLLCLQLCRISYVELRWHLTMEQIDVPCELRCAYMQTNLGAEEKAIQLWLPYIISIFTSLSEAVIPVNFPVVSGCALCFFKLIYMFYVKDTVLFCIFSSSCHYTGFCSSLSFVAFKSLQRFCIVTV